MGAKGRFAGGERRIWGLFGALSLAAVLLGCWAAGAHGTPVRLQALNLAAWVVGAGLAALVARLRATAAAWAWPALALAGLVLTLFAPGLWGVHRWFGLGPVRFNAAELLLPIALVGCAGLERRSTARLWFAPAVLILLAVQPDVSQAAAVAAASAVMLITARQPRLIKALAALVSTLAVVVAELRPDPLAPVPEVEGIVRLAAAVAPILAVLGVAAIAGAVLTPLALARPRNAPVRDEALVLTTYFVVTALAPAFGAFPVPLMGMGISPILGAWLGLGALMQSIRLAGSGGVPN